MPGGFTSALQCPVRQTEGGGEGGPAADDSTIARAQEARMALLGVPWGAAATGGLLIAADLDGTIAATIEPNARAYAQAFAAAGLPFDRPTYEAAFGLRFDEMMERVAPQANSAQRQTVRQAKKAAYAQAMPWTLPNAGLVALLRTLRGTVPIALVTTAARANAEAAIEAAGASGLFATCVFGEDVRRGKPDPEAYLLAFERLTAATQTHTAAAVRIAFEDTDLGAQAARAAGAFVIQVAVPRRGWPT